MDGFKSIRHLCRRLKRRIGAIGWTGIGSGLVLSALIAGGQGLFELYEPDLGVLDSLRNINLVWVAAFLLTMVGLMVTSGFLWVTFSARRAAEARLVAALKMTVRSFGFGEAANARATVYLADEGTGHGKLLYQEIAYVYAHFDEYKFGIGREGLSESVGIVGHVYRLAEGHEEGLSAFVPGATKQEFCNNLIAEPWNFPAELAAKVNHERRNYLAFRFSCQKSHRQPTISGVLFFDAKGDAPLFDESIQARVFMEQLDLVVDYVAECFG